MVHFETWLSHIKCFQISVWIIKILSFWKIYCWSIFKRVYFLHIFNLKNVAHMSKFIVIAFTKKKQKKEKSILFQHLSLFILETICPCLILRSSQVTSVGERDIRKLFSASAMSQPQRFFPLFLFPTPVSWDKSKSNEDNFS